jgi:hypothetical protein
LLLAASTTSPPEVLRSRLPEEPLFNLIYNDVDVEDVEQTSTDEAVYSDYYDDANIDDEDKKRIPKKQNSIPGSSQTSE